MHTILVVNPASIVTRVAIFEEDRLVFEESLTHNMESLINKRTKKDQVDVRHQAIIRCLREKGVRLDTIAAIATGGGILRPIPCGTYRVTSQMVEELEFGPEAEHPFNLGIPLVYRLEQELNVPAYVVDPISVDELQPVARLSGLPELSRSSLFNALNHKGVARKAAQSFGHKYEEINLIVSFMGGIITVAAHQKGKIIDVNNGFGEGPFSPLGAGSLPALDLIRLCFSGKYTEKELIERISFKGGLYAYLGTANIGKILDVIDRGNTEAAMVLSALIYQVSKEIGAMASVLKGDVQAIIMTGSFANHPRLVEDIRTRVNFIAPVLVYPNEDLRYIAEGVLKVLTGRETATLYE